VVDGPGDRDEFKQIAYRDRALPWNYLLKGMCVWRADYALKEYLQHGGQSSDKKVVVSYPEIPLALNLYTHSMPRQKLKEPAEKPRTVDWQGLTLSESTQNHPPLTNGGEHKSS
jgi:hypothetical protein